MTKESSKTPCLFYIACSGFTSLFSLISDISFAMSLWLSSVLSRLFPPFRGHIHAPDCASSDFLPDHDLHNSWGCDYSSQSVVNHEKLRHLWEQYGRDPTGVRRNYHNLLREYTTLFRNFFNGYYPISLHAHVSDALLPTTVSSLIQNTCASSPLVLNNPALAPSSSATEDGKKIQQFVLDYLGWEELHVTHPRFAVVQGLYGAAFGPLVSTLVRTISAQVLRDSLV